MRYYLAKLMQATALTVILIDFLRRFPNLMNMKVLALSVALFTAGWLVQWGSRK